MAYAAAALGVPVTVVVPQHSARRKVKGLRDLGADVISVDGAYDDAYRVAVELAKSSERQLVESFDSQEAVEAHSTIGYELIEQGFTEGIVYAPIGGGGLLAGLAVALRRFTRIRLVGVQVERVDSMIRSLRRGRLLSLPSVHTWVDGLAVRRPGAHPFSILSQCGIETMLVTHEEVARAMDLLAFQEGVLAEPAGAVAVAGAMTHRGVSGVSAVAIVTGSNFDANDIPSSAKGVTTGLRVGSAHCAHVPLAHVPPLM